MNKGTPLEFALAGNEQASRNRRIRLLALVAMFIVPAALLKMTGWGDAIDIESIQRLISGAGFWGFILFAAICSTGILLHVPGLVFVSAAAFAYAGHMAFLAAYVAGLLSVVVSFRIVRSVGGRVLSEMPNRWIRASLVHLDKRPIVIVVILRAIFILSPAVNYALAVTQLRERDHLVGSAIGLVAPVLLWVTIFDIII